MPEKDSTWPSGASKMLSVLPLSAAALSWAMNWSPSEMLEAARSKRMARLISSVSAFENAHVVVNSVWVLTTRS